ncbi:MAG: hypothetical protein MAG451_00891 [Anaerolineales bacterium]|nr:hypothetical protein [Anaerolineales bacterium]
MSVSEQVQSQTSGRSKGKGLIGLIGELQDTQRFQDQHWEGTFEEYLDIAANNPAVTRSAFQRLYDMILSYGTEEYTENKETIIRYKFFDDPIDDGKDAIYGLDRYLMELVDIFHSAAHRYGTERRVLLLHGPVGSSKSTIVRLLKKGLERYSQTDEGALYTFRWETEDEHFDCPMHEDPLHLIPQRFRADVLSKLNSNLTEDEQIHIEGDLCPACRFVFQRLLERYDGDWTKVISYIRVKRLILSEKDRRGIGTFQPKDEKNQDSTELTGDINYRKIAEYGSDSDPRAFNFDGEFNIANRGLVEFIEVLKLDVAFLYDLLTASQEHKIKPKKFAQTDIDEVIIGHSVAGDTPILYQVDDQIHWATLAELYERYVGCPEGVQVLSVRVETGAVEWTPVRALHRHRFSGQMLQTSQKWGVVETTPNHSIYDRDLKPFYPEERHEVLALRELPPVSLEEAELHLSIPGTINDDSNRAYCVKAQPGWVRIDRPRVATQMRTVYDLHDEQSLNALLTVTAWYVAEGHVNGRNGGVVITQSDEAELERVQGAYQRITTAHGSIDFGAKTDSAWRLYLASEIIEAMLTHYCSEHAASKRLPDFVFNLPRVYQEHLFNELINTDGSRALSAGIDAVVTDTYRDQYFEYKTTSPMLAAQVATLASLLGLDYSVYLWKREDYKDAYRIRFCKGAGVRGGRHHSFEARLHHRPAENEWVYDIECVGNHNFVCGVGNIVCHNTNEPEYRKLQSNEYMEALRDRTVKIDIPYITRLSDEIKIYEKDFNQDQIVGKHIAPHVIELAAMWAVLTRMEEPKHAGLTLLQKMKLYDGKSLRGFTEDSVKELKAEVEREGMEGISPRYIQDKISNALVNSGNQRHAEAVDPRYPDGCVNPFMVLNEMETGLKHHSLINSDEQRQRFRALLAVVKEEYGDIVKNEVQRAIAADEEAIQRLAANYIDNVRAYTQREKVRNKFTGQDEEPDERLMRSVEEKINIPENRKDDFRREIMNYIAALSLDGKKFRFDSNPRLHKALELKLFEDQKDSIKLTSLVTSVIDQETQEKIDVVKSRMIKNYGYCQVCATDVLNYVASIFARGDVRDMRT